MPKALTQRTEFYDVWHKFISTGSLEIVPEKIRSSWKRCREMGIDPKKEITSVNIDQRLIQKRIDEQVDLHQILNSHYKNIEKYYDFIPIAILFSDEDGFLLSTSGHDKILKLLAMGTVEMGGSIQENALGTTAPGICLIEGRPATVIAEEHYSQTFHWASCIATPVFDQQNNLLGCLDFTSTVDHGEKIKPLIPLLLNIANSIQFEISLKQRLQQFELFDSYFRSTFEYSDSILILVNRRGEIIYLNRKAQEFFRIDPDVIRNVDVRKILGNESRIARLLKGSPVEKIAFPGHTGSNVYSVESIPIFNQMGLENACLFKLMKEKAPVVVAENLSNTACYDFKNIVGRSKQILDVIEQAKIVAGTQSNILIEGETGTGKELFAHAIHKASRFCSGPFVALNCAAIPHELIESELFGYERGAYTGARKEGNTGKLEQANGGTLFLDEIHTMDLSAQMKILRVIEDRQVTRIGGKSPVSVNIRVIAASTKKLEDEAARDNFLPALFFRLNVVRLYIPGLKERKEDIPLLVEHFIKEMNEKFNSSIRGIEPEAFEVLSQYSWPGNVRELKNYMECAFNFCSGDIITLDHFKNKIKHKSIGEAEKRQTIDDITKNLLIDSLNQFGNAKEAANALGISVSTFYRKKKKFGLSK